MIILVHSETDESSLAHRLGLAEYSYFFVLRAFRPVLERIGLVVAVTDPAREVDRLWRQAEARGEACVFLSFSPPHRTQTGLACPTIPVFAWEFDSIPNESWAGDPAQDWVDVLRRLGRAIVHSSQTADIIRQALGADYPVISIPAPVWDTYAPSAATPCPASITLTVQGTILDTRAIGMSGLPHDSNWVSVIEAERALRGPAPCVALEGVVYSSVFNPEDGRKNWADMLGAFCRVFATEAGATLVLKLTHFDATWSMALMLRHLVRLWPFACRIVLIHGFLPDSDYAKLVDVTTYTVNTSHGEGQCLPLMEAMSAGKPAVAPPHSGMEDYLDEACAFLVRTTAEPASWPQDTRAAIRTHRRRIDLASLEQAFRESYQVAASDAARYKTMSQAASERLRCHCSEQLVEARLRQVVAKAATERIFETRSRFEPQQGTRSQEIDMSLQNRVAALTCYRDRPPPDLRGFVIYDPADARHRQVLLERHAFSCEAEPGNVVLLHRDAGKALSSTPVRMRGRNNTLIVDRACAMHGSIDMNGDGNLAIFEGSQGYLAIGLTLYQNDTLIWGRGSSSFGVRIWVQGGKICSIGEDCLFSENITFRCTDHHSIFDVDTGRQINAPASITIGKHVWIGQDCAIGKGVTIGDGAIIGARSLVVRPVGSAELWAGSPARKLRERVSWTHSHPVMDPGERDRALALLGIEATAG